MAKRARCSNWENQEKLLMRMIIRPYIYIIENKETTTKTNNIKRRAWSEITEKFNKANFRPRDKKQIMNQWRITKMKMNPNYKKKIFKNGGPSPSQGTNDVRDILFRRVKVEPSMDDYDEMKNTTAEDINPLSAELSPCASQETASNGHSAPASPSHTAPCHIEPLSPTQSVASLSQPSPRAYQRTFRKYFEKNSITGRSYMDMHYFRTQENNRLEKEHLFRMHTMTEFHKQTMKNLKLQEQIYEKILENYNKPT